jgi:hypothetical protein
MNILSLIHMLIILIYFAILHMISKSMMIGQLPIELTLIICSYFECSHVYRVMAMVFNVTFSNVSYIVAISFIDGGTYKRFRFRIQIYFYKTEKKYIFNIYIKAY